MIAKFFAAYLLIGAGLAMWFDAIQGCTYSAEQVIGLTLAFALAGFLVQEIVKSLAVRRVQRKPEIDILTLFKEV